MEEELLTEEKYLDLRGVLGANYSDISRLEKLIDILSNRQDLTLVDRSKLKISEGPNTQSTIDKLMSLKQFLKDDKGDGRVWQNVPNLSREEGESKARFAKRKREIVASRKVSRLVIDTDEGTKELGEFLKSSILTDTAGKSDAQEFGVCIYAACDLAGLNLDDVDPVKALEDSKVREYLSFKEEKITPNILRQLTNLSRQDNWKHTWIESARRLRKEYLNLTVYHFRSNLSGTIYKTYKRLPDSEFTPLDFVKKPEQNKWNPSDIWISVENYEDIVRQFDKVNTLVELNNVINSLSYATEQPKLIGVSLKGVSKLAPVRLDKSRNVARVTNIEVNMSELFAGPIGFKVKYLLDVDKKYRGEFTDEDPVIVFRTAGSWNIVGQLTGKYAEGGKIANLDQYMSIPKPSEYESSFRKFIGDVLATYEVDRQNRPEDEDLQGASEESDMSVENIKPDIKVQKYLKLEGIDIDRFIELLQKNTNRSDLLKYLCVRCVCLEIIDRYGKDVKLFTKILRYCQSQIEGISSDFIKIH